MVDETSIVSLMSRGAPSEACRALVDAANEAGGEDNITVIVACCQPGAGGELGQTWTAGREPPAPIIPEDPPELPDDVAALLKLIGGICRT